MKVNNMPEDAYKYKYVVARQCDGGMWFWGAWDDIDGAKSAATEIGGIVIETRCVV